MSWMLTGGNRGKLKNAVARYLKALDEAIREEEKKWEAEEAARIEAWKKKVEEGSVDKDDENAKPDPEAAWKEYERRVEAQEAAIRKLAFEAAFGKLKAKDWEKLDRKWQKWAIGK